MLPMFCQDGQDLCQICLCFPYLHAFFKLGCSVFALVGHRIFKWVKLIQVWQDISDN